MPAKQILIVEDDASIRDLLTELFSSENYSVVTAENGQEALFLFERDLIAPCLILLDLMMPIMDGPTFLKEFSIRYPRYRNLPICVLTAVGTSELPRFSDARIKVIRKPLNVEALVAAAEMYCRD